MRYEGTVYRPPSEAYSLIIQATVGCSHNGCTFCNMYKAKKFHMHKVEEVMEDLMEARSLYNYVDRIFLADGDALIYRTDELVMILDEIARLFPECQRVSSYATPRSLLLKTPEELKRVHEHGLELLYLGLESGSDIILTNVNKGHSASEIIEAGQKAKAAGYQLSVTVLSGLGGEELIDEHAIKTAEAITAMKPDFVGEMTLNIIPGTKLYDLTKEGKFKMPCPEDILKETRLMIENIDNEGCMFRSNHVSNYVNIRGNFNSGRADMIAQIDSALENGTFKVRHYTNM